MATLVRGFFALPTIRTRSFGTDRTLELSCGGVTLRVSNETQFKLLYTVFYVACLDFGVSQLENGASIDATLAFVTVSIRKQNRFLYGFSMLTSQKLYYSQAIGLQLRAYLTKLEESGREHGYGHVIDEVKREYEEKEERRNQEQENNE